MTQRISSGYTPPPPTPTQPHPLPSTHIASHIMVANTTEIKIDMQTPHWRNHVEQLAPRNDAYI